MTQTNGFFTTSDQAHLYYEVHGKGQPLFSCTWLAVFFQILAAQYSRTFQALSGNSYG